MLNHRDPPAHAGSHRRLDFADCLIDTAALLAARFTADGLHPNAAGYARTAALVDSAIAGALAPHATPHP